MEGEREAGRGAGSEEGGSEEVEGSEGVGSSAGGGGVAFAAREAALKAVSLGFGGWRVVIEEGSTEMRSPGCSFVLGSECCTHHEPEVSSFLPPSLLPDLDDAPSSRSTEPCRAPPSAVHDTRYRQSST